MSISLNTQAIAPNLENGAVGVKVAQLAKEQQKAEGKIAVDLIAAAAPKPVGNAGHNINTTA
ncbi:cytoplasmic protein [Shewanella baltica]|jgi:hypothetical protein|uniref:Uncharacterized protein n=3 Tax=Shewanella TaxID=22 RepID=A9L1J0_SHEB9|nr:MULTISPECIES: hypothetical protein [Shewanella]MBO6226731.1 cytoplasmic protein [Shewanella sp.]ABN60388.1 conserved hypothetical protein [Shewanella baltica OS155]ABS09628.1 conserved hypothetical protein [Shewanella baltica OS185]ABX50786.1 conserved hypothetical protein [Shewanella baltica OS195]ACK47913.1 conserved hypothetical protein [Shewanella baltica OS223]